MPVGLRKAGREASVAGVYYRSVKVAYEGGEEREGASSGRHGMTLASSLSDVGEAS